MWIAERWREWRYAARTLAAGRLFTLVAIVCLALGIATNTTMFSVFDAMFLRPLPFKNPDQLVWITSRNPQTGGRGGLLSMADVRELTPSLQLFDGIAAYDPRTVTLTDGGEPERIHSHVITANLFPLLGESPQRGHGFTPEDDQAAAAGVVLISDALWRRRYQSAESVIGRVIRLDNVPYTIVGVMPPKFAFPFHTELWTAMGPVARLGGGRVSVLGRMKGEATVEAANAEMAAHVVPAKGSRPAHTAFGQLLSASTMRAGSEERTIIGALMGATTVLLLLACANVANLLLARGARRRREIAVRAAIGASRGRIIRQLLTESVLLALISAAVALPLAWYGITSVHDAVPPTDPLGPYYIDWSLDLRTFGYAVGIALVTGVLFGLVPAFAAAGRHLLSPLREGAGASSSRGTRHTHHVLIVVQMTLALLLLAGASIFVRTYAGLHSVELGYDTSHLMTMRVYLPGTSYDQPAQARFVDQLAEQIRSLPGAHAATVTDLVPLDDQGGHEGSVAVEGRMYEEGKEPTVTYAGVGGAWAETLNVPVEGRTFYDNEWQGQTPVALANRTLVSAFWPGQNPIGKRFRFSDDPSSPWITVIGVVPDIRTVKLDESGKTPPTAYLPHRFVTKTDNWGIIVRTQGAPGTVTSAVAAAVHSIDPSVALFDVYPMEQVRWLSYWMYVMWGTMFGVFGVIALFIAAVGVYGVIYYTVAQRTKEIGLRVALGAGRAQVVGPMMRQVAVLAALGIALGLAGAWFINPLVGTLLIGVSPTDPASFAVVSILLAATALLATWIPAWRAATNANPLEALRAE